MDMKSFWDKVNKTSTCWIWIAFRDPDGYGKFTFHQRKYFAHRFSYELIVGKISEGKEIDHLCRNRACVNPDHLEPVDHRTNTMRGFGFCRINADKTHCDNGHEFTLDNTYILPNGTRRCRACNLASVHAYNSRKAKTSHPADAAGHEPEAA